MLHLVGYILKYSYDARTHERKKKQMICFLFGSPMFFQLNRLKIMSDALILMRYG